MGLTQNQVAGHGRLKFAVINAAGAGDNAIVTAVANTKIRVVGYVLVGTAGVTAKFRSNTTDITGPLPLVASSGVSYPGETPAFETARGEALNLNLGAAIGVGGHLTYVEEA